MFSDLTLRRCALHLSLLIAAMPLTPAYAQSTGTSLEEAELDEVVIASARVVVNSLMVADGSPKSRTNVSAEYIASQPAGQSIIQSLNLVPGVNFTNNDPYGASGGNLRMRGFDGNRISLMLDGVPLNDTGNYAIFTNQQMDPEIIQQASVNLGTTDVDSPTASATGGTINLSMRRPSASAQLQMLPSLGSYHYRRVFGSLDTGAVGAWQMRGLLAVSEQRYDKFKGPGDLARNQFNVGLFQPLRGEDFVSIALHFNRNRNNFYRNISKADIAANGYDLDNDPTCARVAGVAGSAQNEATTATGTTPSCTNYYNVRVNPSDTGNVRIQSRFALGEQWRLTVDPSYQYVAANGGGISIIPESDPRLKGRNNAAGVDLNGDGDVLDRVALYTPNNTGTNRYVVNSSLLWTFADGQILRLGYTLDHGRHRQTGQYGFLDGSGNPEDVFAGLRGIRVSAADGVDLRGRDRYSVAHLDQVSLSYSGRLVNDQLRIAAGIRLPRFRRELTQYCYTSTTGAAYCTTQTASAPNASGLVTFAGVTGNYLPPYSGTKKYDKVLPNIGLSWHPRDTDHEVYVSYAEGLSAPRTDNLYNVQILNVLPETTRSTDLGYRFNGSAVVASAAFWQSHYENRIVTAFDPDLGLSVDRNVGTVNLYGFDGSLGAHAGSDWTLYATASYNHSRIVSDIQYNATVYVPTAGKELVETPRWTYGARAELNADGVILGLQGKYVDSRWATDTNDEAAPSYLVFDADARVEFGPRWALQVNLVNVFNKQYLGGVTTSRFSADTSKPYGALPLYSVGAPRTFQLSLRATF
jgi:iron complex outermembrane receptor protein